MRVGEKCECKTLIALFQQELVKDFVKKSKYKSIEKHEKYSYLNIIEGIFFYYTKFIILFIIYEISCFMNNAPEKTSILRNL